MKTLDKVFYTCYIVDRISKGNLSPNIVFELDIGWGHSNRDFSDSSKGWCSASTNWKKACANHLLKQDRGVFSRRFTHEKRLFFRAENL